MKQTAVDLIGVFIIRFCRLLKMSCPKCKIGKLTQDDIHHCWGGGELNVYSCDTCNAQFV